MARRRARAARRHLVPPPDRGRLPGDQSASSTTGGAAARWTSCCRACGSSTSPGTSWLAETEDGRLAGFLIGFLSPDHAGRRLLPPDRDEPEPPAARPRAGAVRALLRRRAGRRPARASRAITWPGNRLSIAFHRALGFEVRGRPGSQNLYGTPAQAGYDFDREDRAILVRRHLTGRDPWAGCCAGRHRSAAIVLGGWSCSATTCRATPSNLAGRRLLRLRRPTTGDRRGRPAPPVHRARTTAEVVFVGDFTPATDAYPSDDDVRRPSPRPTASPAFNAYTGPRLQRRDSDYDMRRVLRRPSEGWTRGRPTRSSATPSGVDDAPMTQSIKKAQ